VPQKSDSETVVVDGREVTISNPEKVLFPEAGYTKLDVVRYYLAVGEGALRAAGNRPNVLVRYPNGIGGEFFYQKRAPTSRPPWIDGRDAPISLRPHRGGNGPAREGSARVDGEPAPVSSCIRIRCAPTISDHPDELRIDLDPVPASSGRRFARSRPSSVRHSPTSA
jgi:DNA primase